MGWHLTAAFLAGVLTTYVCLQGAPFIKEAARYLPANPLPSTAQQQQETVAEERSPLGLATNAGGSSSARASRSLLGDNISIALADESYANSTQARQLLYHGSFTPAWRQEYSTYKSRWHPTVLASVFKAQQKLKTTAEQRSSRMFVPMLSNRHSELCCMLTDLNAKVGATNPLDVFIFTVDNKAEDIYNRSPCWRRNFNITVVFLPLDEHWGADPECSSSAMFDTNGWLGMPGLFGDNYRRMGHWRLTFQFAFADMLGYKYVWQLDDDSFFRSPVNFNMVDYMQQHSLWVAGVKTLPDPHFVTWGLPEMARLFLVAERMAPPGTLFSNHTAPPGLEGLYTVVSNPVRTQHPLEGDAGGWSRTIIHGNCMIMDMDKFWWTKEAQKFVELVIQTGFHYRFRWNEQGVMAMLWQIFVPQGHFQFDDLPLDYIHPRKTWGTC